MSKYINSNIITLTYSEDGIFAHVSTPDGKHCGINVRYYAVGDDIINKFFAAVADRVMLMAENNIKDDKCTT